MTASVDEEALVKRSGSQFAAAVKVIAQRDLRSEESHPSQEELRNLVAGKISPGSPERERLEDHLALCRECADLVLKLPRSPSLLQRLQVLFAASRVAYSVAALCAAALLLVLWMPSAPEPHGNVHLATLTPKQAPEDSAQRGTLPDSEFEILAIPAQADSVLLILGFAEPQAFDRYQAEIVDLSQPGREVIWSSPDLRRMPEGNLSLEVPSGYLSSGRYSVVLYGMGREAAQPLVEYLVRVTE